MKWSTPNTTLKMIKMSPDFSNQVKIAVDRIGGPTRAAHTLRVSNATIHSWIKNRRVPDIAKAEILSKASGIEIRRIRSTR